jgi:hypothetical protein
LFEARWQPSKPWNFPQLVWSCRVFFYWSQTTRLATLWSTWLWFYSS